MVHEKKGQISVEYLIVVGFVVFVVIGLLGIAFFYANGIRDRIRLNQVENFANKIISNSEAVFFAGEPSKVTITAYMPAGIEDFRIFDLGTKSELVFDVSTDTGVTVIGYQSDVPIDVNSNIDNLEGLKKIEIEAFEINVKIIQV